MRNAQCATSMAAGGALIWMTLIIDGRHLPVQLALANTPTSQRANEPTTSSLTGRTVTSSGPYLSKTPTTHESRPVLHPGIECVLCVVPQCEPRRLATSTVHSPQSTVQGSESSPPNREAGKSLRRNPDAVTSCEHEHESPWPTGHQTPCSESCSQLSSRKSDTTPRCSHTKRKFVLPHPRMYRLDLNLRLNWPGQCTVYGVRLSRRSCAALLCCQWILGEEHRG